MFKIYGGATKFTQWTKDQKLIMSELPIGADVLFYNDPNEDEPTITEVYEIYDEEGNAIRVCDVPNIFLTETKKIKVRIPKRVRGIYGTMHSIAGQNEKYFEVEPAEKPSDYVYEKTVTNTIDPKRLPEGYPWKESRTKIILEDTIDITTYEAEIPGYTSGNYSGSEYLEDGKHYVVEVNGIEYSGIAIKNAYGTNINMAIEDLGISVMCRPDRELLEAYSFFEFNDTQWHSLPVKITAPNDIINPISSEFLPTEEWTFTLEDGSTVIKKVAVG